MQPHYGLSHRAETRSLLQEYADLGLISLPADIVPEPKDMHITDV